MYRVSLDFYFSLLTMMKLISISEKQSFMIDYVWNLSDITRNFYLQFVQQLLLQEGAKYSGCLDLEDYGYCR